MKASKLFTNERQFIYQLVRVGGKHFAQLKTYFIILPFGSKIDMEFEFTRIDQGLGLKARYKQMQLDGDWKVDFQWNIDIWQRTYFNYDSLSYLCYSLSYYLNSYLILRYIILQLLFNS